MRKPIRVEMDLLDGKADDTVQHQDTWNQVELSNSDACLLRACRASE